MTSKLSNLHLVRCILRELRHFNNKEVVRKQMMYSYVLEQFRRFQVTENKYCYGEHEMRHLGQTYLCLLQSVRRQEELHEQYKGKGDRSVEEAAEMVGLKLPEMIDALDDPIK